MSQHDLTIANQGFPAFRADLNSALQALGSTQSGTTAPSPTFANQLWYDTANNILKIRNEDNDAWISLFTLDQSADSVSQLVTAITALSAGSASSPSLTASGDTNTGLFFPAADTVGIAGGGSEIAKFESSKLSLPANSSTASSLRLFEDTDNGTNYVDFIAPSSIASNRTLTIPDSTGTIALTSDIPTNVGKILQVVQGTTGTTASTTSATYIDTNLSASITPTSATSKILVLVAQNGVYKVNSAAGVNLKLQRGGSDIHGFAIAAFYGVTTELRGSVSTTYLDSPATTSSTTYKTVFSNDGSGTGTAIVQYNSGSSTSTITLLEIGA